MFLPESAALSPVQKQPVAILAGRIWSCSRALCSSSIVLEDDVATALSLHSCKQEGAGDHRGVSHLLPGTLAPSLPTLSESAAASASSTLMRFAPIPGAAPFHWLLDAFSMCLCVERLPGRSCREPYECCCGTCADACINTMYSCLERLFRWSDLSYVQVQRIGLANCGDRAVQWNRHRELRRALL